MDREMDRDDILMEAVDVWNSIIQEGGPKSEGGFGKGKFIGRDARLTWSRDGFGIEELPVKGKKKLKKASMQNIGGRLSQWVRDANDFIPDNIFIHAKIKQTDSYLAIKAKIGLAMQKAAMEFPKINDENKEWAEKNKGWFRDSIKWYEDTVHYLKVVPEDKGPITFKGKDFFVNSGWTEFSIRKNYGDPGDHEPSYTDYDSKSPTAARKLYNLLAVDPKAMKELAKGDIGDWLKKHKIGYDLHFSQWR